MKKKENKYTEDQVEVIKEKAYNAGYLDGFAESLKYAPRAMYKILKQQGIKNPKLFLK